jgi:outer membrane protein
MRRRPAFNLARTAYLPRIDVLAQANRATRNNVFGMLLPQSAIPSMSGPVLGTNNFGTAWGSAIGVLVSWEPFDFGLRRASVAAATAARTQYEAASQEDPGSKCTVAAADAYVTLVAAQETVRAAQAGVDRAEGYFADDQCAGERAIAARRGRLASRGGTGGGAHATDSGPAGR